MNNCPHCGYQPAHIEQPCPECGRYATKIAELIAEQEADALAHSWRGQYQKIIHAPDKSQACLATFKKIWQSLPNKARFTLFVIFVFVFALIITVL